MKILFVCTGNTCRSPMAEATMKHRCKEKNINIHCASAGVSAFGGDSATPEAIAVMRERGIDLTAHRATRLTPYHIEEYDLVICMTQAHREYLRDLGEKVITLGEDIPDPYGRGIEAYRLCAEKISEGIDSFLAPKVRPMGERDITSIAEIEKECFSSPWSENGIKEELSNNSAHFLVYEARGEVMGYGGMHITLDEGYIANIAVRGSARKSGVGSAILQKLIDTAEEKDCAFLSLEVRKSNTPAISLYEKYGFENVGERKNFYTAPTENAIIMTKYFGKEV